MKRPEPPALVEVDTRIFYPLKVLNVCQFTGELRQMYKWRGVVLTWALPPDSQGVYWRAHVKDKEVYLSRSGQTPLEAFQQLQVHAKRRVEQFDSEVRALLARQQHMRVTFHDVLEDT